MGQSNSKYVFGYNQSAVDLIKIIQTKSHKLRDAYSQEFLDDSFCDQLALIYNDRLLKFRKQEIDGVKYTLGVVNHDRKTKEGVCQVIIDHYVRRLKLIATIEANLSLPLQRILSISTGPRCRGFPETYSQQECQQRSGGQWEEVINLPEDIRENKRWYQQLHDLQREYLKYLKRIESIMIQLDDFDDYITDQRLTDLEREYARLNDRFQFDLFERYRNMLGTRTYTTEEVMEIKRRNAENEKNYLAQNSAIRMSKGLAPLNYL